MTEDQLEQETLGSLCANAERFMQWRTIDGVNLDPLGEFNELQTLIRGALAPQVLLDYLRYFVLFEDDGQLVKKIAGYHQYHAVRAAIGHVVAASRPDGVASQRGKGGVVWHTQGSGKSITMTCFAARVMQEAAMANPTIIVITDRAPVPCSATTSTSTTCSRPRTMARPWPSTTKAGWPSSSSSSRTTNCR